MIAISPIPAFNDNYIWLIENNGFAAVVDPGDPSPVIQALEQNGLQLTTILITHHHADHTGGLAALKQRYSAKVYGPARESIKNIDIPLSQGQNIQLEDLGLSFKILDIPGHTAGHIAFFCENSSAGPILFCGDTLFSGGCGRLFEGTPTQMWDSLQKLSELPISTKVYCAHEYTSSNLQFALAVEPNNADLVKYSLKVQQLRQASQPTLPSTIGLELKINPFLRIRESNVIDVAENRSGERELSESEVFASIRSWKDSF
ncbi:MAG: hydroxyacylglutathione hydrolase [Kangiellaceae bacterium]|nr:hydroxyacylglutathione hydrolase [Kangiellaceae bacterium]